MLKIEVLKSPHPFAANSYLFSSAGEYAIVDPTAPYVEGLCDGRVKYVLLTHAHFDHILEVESWAKAGAMVVISEQDRCALADPMKNCYKLYNGSDNGYFGDSVGLNDGDVLTLGYCEIKFLACPGHTIGSGTFLCDGNAFVGDTICAGGGYGRFDLPTGSSVMLRDSIQKLLSLPDEVVVYPGHGEFTTIKQYKNDTRY